MPKCIIENFSEPTTCWSCPFLTEEEWLCLVTRHYVYRNDQPKPYWCPIKAVPEEPSDGR